jgi:predicted transcriptional regulator
VKYRSRTDIVATILQVAENGAIKTRIMYRSFLSFPQLKEYLELLTESGLLEHNEEEKRYYTTEKGRHFLKMYREIGRILAPREHRTTIVRQ